MVPSVSFEAAAWIGTFLGSLKGEWITPIALKVNSLKTFLPIIRFITVNTFNGFGLKQTWDLIAHV